MAERNRVTPLGDVVAVPLRGAWMGNRGSIHFGHEIVRHHRGRRWIICATEFKGWRAPRWEPNRWTALFFHDEAVALAAGHRPCALCRRASYDAYRRAVGIERADDIDARLHTERWDGTRHRLHTRPWPSVPVGAFALVNEQPALVLADALVPWSVTGYGSLEKRPQRGDAQVITPPTSLTALAAGYPVQRAV